MASGDGADAKGGPRGQKVMDAMESIHKAEMKERSRLRGRKRRNMHEDRHTSPGCPKEGRSDVLKEGTPEECNIIGADGEGKSDKKTTNRRGRGDWET